MDAARLEERARELEELTRELEEGVLQIDVDITTVEEQLDELEAASRSQIQRMCALQAKYAMDLADRVPSVKPLIVNERIELDEPIAKAAPAPQYVKKCHVWKGSTVVKLIRAFDQGVKRAPWRLSP